VEDLANCSIAWGIMHLGGTMAKIVESVLLFLVATGMYVLVPTVIVWGWVRWAKRGQLQGVFSMLPLAGFSLTTLSGLLAAASMAYAHMIGGFPFYDPLLLRIYRWGALLSLVGLLLALGGIARPGALRWHAPVAAAGMFLFWLVAASGE